MEKKNIYIAIENDNNTILVISRDFEMIKNRIRENAKEYKEKYYSINVYVVEENKFFDNEEDFYACAKLVLAWK